MLQLPASVAATSRASRPAAPAITRGHGSRSRIKRQPIGRRRIARRAPRRADDGLCRLSPGKTPREPSIEREDDGGQRPNNEKDGGFGSDRRQKDLQIADRGKPQPIDQEVAREPEHQQADPDGDGRNDEAGQGASPWWFPFGSGNPDRHGVMIAEMEEACRLIRERRPLWTTPSQCDAKIRGA